MKTNALFYGDNLVWLKDRKYFPDESVDLIYLDPPFNSKANYNVLFNEPGQGSKSQAQIKAFDDTWHWDSNASEIALNELAQNRPQIAEFISWLSRQGKNNESMAAYLSMMAIRLVELHRVLKATGSLYLHCDPLASHYLKIIMDAIFGIKNYLNEIAWCYREREITKRFWNKKHDVILFYAKDTNSTNRIFNWKAAALPYSPGTAPKYNLTDEDGRKFQIRGKGGTYTGEQQLPIQVEIEHPEWTYRDYLDKKEGIPPRDWLAPPMGNVECLQCKSIFRPEYQYDWLNRASRERLGYPTQKPLSLLELLINVSSNKGDVVLDPFCGCGTTIDAAQKLKRQWLGIDVTWLAIDLVEKRLKDTYGRKISKTYKVHGKPFDVASAKALASKSKKEFEIWAISLVEAHPREHDGGVDGIFGFVEKDKKTRTIVVQVKGGDVLNPGMVRDLIGTVKKEGAAIGILITLNEPTKGMKSLAIHSPSYKSELWGKEYPSIQIRTVEQLLASDGFDLPPTVSPFKKAQLTKEEAKQLGL